MARWIATLDGPAASGKSTVARGVAARLGAGFLDTGATYRAATLAVVEAGVDLSDAAAVAAVVAQARIRLTADRVFLGDRDVSAAIRSPALTAEVHHLAGAPAVRAVLVELQRRLAADCETLVTEGRDQGTVVFPTAQLKVFLTASAAERARRRAHDLEARGLPCDRRRLEADLALRDERDRTRAVAPLRPAPDAIELDTTGLGIEAVVARVVDLAREAGCPDGKDEPRGGQTDRNP